MYVAGLMAVLMLVTAVPAIGQTPAAEYLLGPGDVIDVAVWGHADLAREVTVSAEGNVVLPLVGVISASGQSVEHLASTISRAYAEYVLNPQVSITIKQFRTVRASVLGEVAHPGLYELRAGARLLDFVAAAGGPNEAAALKEVKLLVPGQAPRKLDLTQALAGDAGSNTVMRGGETLFIPEDLVNLINVEGQVTKPGRYRLKGEMRVLDALLAAGGLTDHASVTQAQLVRASNKSEPLSLDTLLLSQDMSHNVVLQPGDTLMIPEETANKFYVIGDVPNPGAFTLKGDVTTLQAVSMAGGPVPRGLGTARTAYIVRRPSGSPGVVAGPAKAGGSPPAGAPISVDLQAAMHASDSSHDVPIQPGDVVVIPQTGMARLQWLITVLAPWFAPIYIFK
jgi:polysaccharide export outer membrane protein